MKVRYSYLPQQFENPKPILQEIENLLKDCRFTLGPPVKKFEESFASLIGTKYAVGVGSGTDAIKLGLKAAGVGYGDEVITAANTFIATAGAINETGAKNVFVDVTPYYTIDISKIEAAITQKTKAICPVHLTGEPADMPEIMTIAKKHNLAVVEDACQGILANVAGKNAGSFGDSGAFSLHPLKNLNVWGDAGMVVTNSDTQYEKLKLIRNHGLKNRDEIDCFGYNSRLDSIQAVVGNALIDQAPSITESRISNGAYYDQAFRDLPITIPTRRKEVRRVFHLYMIEVEPKHRDRLVGFLQSREISAKIHYPIPLYLQKGLIHLGYQPGDFPETDRQAKQILTLPVDQHLERDQIDFTIDSVREYFCGKK